MHCRVSLSRSNTLALSLCLVILFSWAAPLAIAGDIYKNNPNDVLIPDDAESFAFSRIVISGFPDCATVTGVDLHYKLEHWTPSELRIDLQYSLDVDSTVWHILCNDGQCDAEREFENIGIFNGLQVNRDW